MSKFIWKSQRKLHPKNIGLSGELKKKFMKRVISIYKNHCEPV